MLAAHPQDVRHGGVPVCNARWSPARLQSCETTRLERLGRWRLRVQRGSNPKNDQPPSNWWFGARWFGGVPEMVLFLVFFVAFLPCARTRRSNPNPNNRAPNRILNTHLNVLGWNQDPSQKLSFFGLVSGKQRDPKKAQKEKVELILGKNIVGITAYDHFARPPPRKWTRSVYPKNSTYLPGGLPNIGSRRF